MKRRPDLRGRRLLIVDDEPADRHAIGRLAEAQGCVVRHADGHDEMAAIMRTWDVEMLVLDIVMPHVDGIGILRRLAEGHCRLPVLLVSAYKNRLKPVRNLGSVYGLRVVGEISKPVEATALEAALNAVFAAAGGIDRR